MRGGIPPLPQYAFMVWCSVEAQGQLYLYILKGLEALTRTSNNESGPL
jgi:hypothetical protein